MITPSKMVLRFFVLLILLCGFHNGLFANITVTPGSGGTNICNSKAVGGTAPAFTTLGVITMTEGAAGDFGGVAGLWTATVTLNAPAGWQFKTTAPLPTFSPAGGNIIAVAQVSLTAGAFTISIRGFNNNSLDVVTITGLQVQATAIGSGPGNITPTINGGTVTGLTPATNMGSLSLTTPPGAITGNTTICSGGVTTQLSDGAAGGTWSSSLSAVSTVGSATGLVTSGAQGTATITYDNGCVAPATTTVTVNAAPVAIGGVTTVCSGLTTQLSDGSTGGIWSTNTTSVATVGSATGLVTAGAQGTATITYANGCGAPRTTTVTVNATAGAISGNTTICSIATTTLSDASTGGIWSTSTSSVATVGSVTGLVTGGAQGTATITFANGCGAPQTTTVTVNGIPGAISGVTSVCSGATTTLSDFAAGGTWSTLNPAVATVGSTTALVTGGVAGTATINYSNGCGTVGTIVTVGAPDAGTISGLTGVCSSSTIPLSDGVPGGAWSSDNTTAATIDPVSGMVTGGVPGTAVISYSTINSCGPAVATYTVTSSFAANAGTITGPTNMCAGSFTIVTDGAPGGVWSVSNVNASITGTGLLTAITPGVDIISYTVTNACGPTSATQTVTISPFLDAGTITGPTSLCPGTTIVLTDNVSGGVWSSSNTSLATISGFGVVSGISGGATTISYLIISGCGSVAATYNVTVNPTPDPGTIIGPSVICTGTFAVLSDTAPGGVWSSSNTLVATVTNSGTVTAIIPGTATITYSVTNVCGTLATIHTMTFSLPPDPGTISGLSSVCAGSSIPLSDNAAGGVWSSSNTNATVSGTGVVTGVTAGTATIIYTSTTACASLATSAIITINPLPVAGTISGPSVVCAGSSIALTDATAGGVWSSSNNIIATVDASGSVTGVNPGSTTINYSVTNICGTIAISYPVTVNPVPVVAAITGAGNVCVGGSVTLSDDTPGGLWVNSNTNVSIFIAASGLVVTGISAGTATISYTLTNGFGCSTTVTTNENINAMPAVTGITGANFGCVGATSVLSDATPGGVWSSDNATIATVNAATGQVAGVATGSVNILYSVTNIGGCTTTVSFADNIMTIPSLTATTGIMTLCMGTVTTLSNSASGGVWSSSNTNATVSATGIVTAYTAGTDNIIYAVTNVCGTVFNSAVITINPLPVAGTISALYTSICAGSSVVLSESVSGGVWSSGNTAIATVNNTGIVSGIAAGSAAISYKVTNGFGCVSAATIAITIGPALPSVTLLPGSSATLCHGNPVHLHVASSGGAPLTYQWSIGSTPIPGATDSVYVANIAGSYSVIINNGTCSEALGNSVITVAPNAVISFTPPNVLYTGSFVTYQWFLNGVLIPGETTSLIHETSGGDYTVVVTDANGCSDTSAVYTLISTGINNSATAQDINIYPNPATSILHIDASVKVNVSILSIDGKLLITQKDASNIDVHDLANGMYMIMIYDQNNIIIKTMKFAKAQ